MDFEKHGFRTGKVLVPGLDQVVTLDSSNYFRNDGIVQNINDHTYNLMKEFNAPIIECRKDDYARHYFVENNGRKGVAIFIKEGGPELNSFNYGHESAHALISLGMKDAFLEIIKEMGFTLNPLERYRKSGLNPFKRGLDEEKVAHVGGLVSAYKNGQLGYFQDKSAYPTLAPIIDDLMKSRV